MHGSGDKFGDLGLFDSRCRAFAWYIGRNQRWKVCIDPSSVEKLQIIFDISCCD